MNELITGIPNAPKVNHRKLGWKDKFDLCARWKESGFSKSKFCREHKIPIPTFCNWCNRLWPENKKIQKPRKLTPVRIINPTVDQSVTVELLFTNNAQAKIQLPLSSIGVVIKELCHATTTIR